jgi:hypothetical protein
MYKNFTLTESERESILNQHIEHGYKQPLNESTSFTNGKSFDKSEIDQFKKRNFKVGSMKAISPDNSVTVTKNDQGNWVISKDGKVVYTGPHDDCDVQLDKIIGYNSLQGGYTNKK